MSVMPAEMLLSSVKEGLLAAASRILIARPYRELYSEFVPAGQFDEPSRRTCPPLLGDRSFNCRQSPLLSPRDGPGPTYSPDEALDRVRIRYEKSLNCAGFTVRALMANTNSRDILTGWHQEGMRDWEILSIIANAANNIRFPLSDADGSSTEWIERHRAGFDLIESAEIALAPDLFPNELLRLQRQAFQAAYLRSWRLDIPMATSDEKAIEAFLINRYGLRSDDLGHTDIFEW